MSVTMPGPVMVAAGCGGAGADLARFVDVAGLDIVTRTVTLDPVRAGSSGRVVESSGGVLVTDGADNPGLSAFLSAELPALVRAGARPYVSIAGATPGELVDVVRRLAVTPGLSGIEVNLAESAPAEQGLYAPRELYQFGALVTSLRREFTADLPVLVKVRGGSERAADLARTAHEAGANGVVLCTAQPAALPDGTWARLCGPALAPVTARALREVAAACADVPLIASGGVHDVPSARACLAAGAIAVQVGSALFTDPTLVDPLRADLTAAHAQHDPTPHDPTRGVHP